MAVLPFITIAELAYDAGWRGEDHAIAIAVTVPESGRRTDAVNDQNTDGSVDRGLWQINSIHGFDPDRLLADPAYNARCAYEVWTRQGWGAWVAYQKGLHEPSLDAAKVAMDARQRLAIRDSMIASRDRTIQAQTVELMALRATVADRDAKIAERDRQIAVLLVQVTSLENSLADARAELDTVRADVRSTLEALLGRL